MTHPEICPSCLQVVQPISARLLTGANDIVSEINRFDISMVDTSDMKTVGVIAKATNLLYRASDEINKLRSHRVMEKLAPIDKGVVNVVRRLESCACTNVDETKALVQEAAIWLRALSKYIEGERE